MTTNWLVALFRKTKASTPASRSKLSLESLEERSLLSAALPVTLVDPGINAVVTADYTRDHTLTRSDMIGVFQEVVLEDGAAGKITATQLKDLKKLDSRRSGLGLEPYVQELAHKVVHYNEANETFQGHSLLGDGVLTAGKSTGKDLTELYEKWFLGEDLPSTRVSGQTYAYKQAAGSLFGPNGPVYQDVDQGALGDCYYLATLGEIADRNPQAIRDMFLDNGDGTFTVRFFKANGKQDFITVDRELPVDSSGRFIFDGYGNKANDPTNVLWVELAEKAYAQLAASGWSRRADGVKPADSYHAIEYGNGNEPMQQIIGEQTFANAVSAGNMAALLADVQAGELVTLGSKWMEPANSPVFESHEYYITGYDAATQTYTVVNPWGYNYTQNGQNLGTLHLTASQIVMYFDEFDVGAASAQHAPWH
jgi:hypothetical protein